MNRRLSAPDSSLNAPLRSEFRNPNGRTGWPTTPSTRKRGWPNGRDRRAARVAHDGAGRLTERERDIIEARRLREDPATLEELSQKYGVSRERVRQIEVRAFEKLQNQMKRALAEKRSHTLAA